MSYAAREKARRWYAEHQKAERKLANKRRREQGISASDQRIADRIDGYDRDDLGESPDY